MVRQSEVSIINLVLPASLESSKMLVAHIVKFYLVGVSISAK